jgi:hypothetical protein
LNTGQLSGIIVLPFDRFLRMDLYNMKPGTESRLKQPDVKPEDSA